MRGPASVRHSYVGEVTLVHVDLVLGIDEFLEGGHFADLLEQVHLRMIIRIAVNSNAYVVRWSVSFLPAES